MELWKQPLYIPELPKTSNSAIPQCIIPQFHNSIILHDGFGQDDEWVAANFTNATEILAVGRSAPRHRSSASVWGNSGHWVGGYGGFETGYNPGDENATYWWLPSIIGTPDLPSTGPDGDSVEFSAVLFDCNNGDDISFTWTVSDGLTAVSPYAQTTEVEAESSPDWNGGCEGYDEGGARYYPYNTLLSDVLQRMMMYGVEHDDLTGCDITAGSVHGIWYTLQQSDYIWHAFGAPVGFFDTELEITPMQTE